MTAILIPLWLAAAAPAVPPDGVATLEAITIEGEVAVPQVLFITSRDHPRHAEDLGRRLRLTLLHIARGAPGPGLPVVVEPASRPLPMDDEHAPAKESKP